MRLLSAVVVAMSYVSKPDEATAAAAATHAETDSWSAKANSLTIAAGARPVGAGSLGRTWSVERIAKVLGLVKTPIRSFSEGGSLLSFFKISLIPGIVLAHGHCALALRAGPPAEKAVRSKTSRH